MACGGRKFKIKGLAAKIEATYGVDSVPTAALNAIETVEASIQPLVAETVEHDIDRPGGGNNPTELVGKHIIINAKVAFAGSGTAGDVPAYDVLLRACGLAVVPNPGTDVRYTRITTGEESATLYFWMDGALHQALGARGKFTIEFNNKQIPYINFEFMALYAGPVTQAAPALTLSGFTRPFAMSNAATVFSFHSITPAVESFNFDAGQQVEHMDKPGCESVDILEQKPAGSIAIDALALAAYDPFGLAIGGDLDTVSVTHGTVAGRITELVSDFAEISTVDYADHASKLGYSHSLRFLPDPAAVGPDYEIIIR